MAQQVQVRADVLEDGRTVVWVTGDVDLAAEASLTQRTRGSCRQWFHDTVVVDLSGVPFLDSSGIRALVRAHLAAAEVGLDIDRAWRARDRGTGVATDGRRQDSWPGGRGRRARPAHRPIRAMTWRPGDGLSPWYDAIARLLHAGHLASGSDLPDLANSVMEPLGVQVVIHLADLEQRSLRALVDSAGRATTAAVDRGQPRWPGVHDGRADHIARATGTALVALGRRYRAPRRRRGHSWRRGLDPEDDTLRRGCGLLASLLGHLIVAKVPYGDTISRTRRSQPLSTAAQLLWRLLPPLTFANGRMVISAILEP